MQQNLAIAKGARNERDIIARLGCVIGGCFGITKIILARDIKDGYYSSMVLSGRQLVFFHRHSHFINQTDIRLNTMLGLPLMRFAQKHEEKRCKFFTTAKALGLDKRLANKLYKTCNDYAWGDRKNSLHRDVLQCCAKGFADKYDIAGIAGESNGLFKDWRSTWLKVSLKEQISWDDFLGSINIE